MEPSAFLGSVFDKNHFPLAKACAGRHAPGDEAAGGGDPGALRRLLRVLVARRGLCGADGGSEPRGLEQVGELSFVFARTTGG